MLAIPWAYLMWNITIGAWIPALHFRSTMTLAGVIAEAAPKFTMKRFLSYAWQSDISRAIGVLSPIYKPAIHWKNQIYYSLFDTSSAPGVIVGPGRQLLTENYITLYCSFNLRDFNARAPGWVADIRTIQDFFESRGVTFLYVITPSKAAVYPATIPTAYTCPSALGDQREKLMSYRHDLDRAGVHTVDSATATRDAAATSPIALFARGGVHWNTLAAGQAAQQVTDNVDQRRGSGTLTPFTLSWTRSIKPEGADRDALDLMNLVWPDANYEVPAVTYHAQPTGSCKSTHITEVGSSFSFRLDEALAAIACPPRIDLWWYWGLNHFRYPGSTSAPQPVDPEERRHSLLDDPDIVILEENESLIPRTTQGEDLLGFVGSQQAAESAAQRRVDPHVSSGLGP
jgi:alginate O-acetyltransferase complex protein AlgJ